MMKSFNRSCRVQTSTDLSTQTDLQTCTTAPKVLIVLSYTTHLCLHRLWEITTAQTVLHCCCCFEMRFLFVPVVDVAMFPSSRVRTASGFMSLWVCGSSSSLSSCYAMFSLVTTSLCGFPMMPGTSSSWSSSPSPTDTWPVSACALDLSKCNIHTEGGAK